MKQRVEIVTRILDSNDQLAEQNRKKLDAHQVFAINVMASPGAGKTSFIVQTIAKLPEGLRLGVIEGDTAPVTIDSDKIIEAGMPAIQINTGGNCHLDANMVGLAINQLNLDDIDLLLIENVGNLICPAGFALGNHANIVIASIPEGDDKPYKYPNIYRNIDVLIINKIDLLPYIDFRMDYFREGVEMLNPGLKTFEVNSKTGEGFDGWIEWLKERVSTTQK
ncbi:MAG: hydrogenase nickel incorporation protein HypB [Anaerolineaceae bacterium]|jgi:hydrogenase nickel incorporation protein HypB|nr:hydrogenase nickel incorporation protein HypB [Anaerolineaceae bacterium]MDD4042207.1 hydrogenase nickel incorporation protein HypB [Anaerolineaceae bacterium]MDD4577043.1 hydrogenase nickel incorporation protein HypB [Anaerolineaceae bacterium]